MSPANDYSVILMWGSALVWGLAVAIFVLALLVGAVGRQRVAQTRAFTEQIKAASAIDRDANSSDWRERIEERISSIERENNQKAAEAARAAGFVMFSAPAPKFGDFLTPWSPESDKKKRLAASHPIPCEACGSCMVLRLNKRTNDGSISQWFWGCSNFPKCRNSRDAECCAFDGNRCLAMDNYGYGCLGTARCGSRSDGFGDVNVCQKCARYAPIG